MNQQPPRRSLFHALLSALIRKVPEETKQYVQLPQRPVGHDPDAWRTYWQALSQPWRAKPEVDLKRQAELARRRDVVPDIQRGIYPFEWMKLSRADVEWLLATHENGRGPVIWGDEGQQDRKGLDLRGADLQGEDLSGLPLVRMQGGLSQGTDWNDATAEQRETAAVHLEGTSLRGANLKGAILNNAHLEGADLRTVHLEGATLNYTHLEGKTMPIDSQRQVQKNVPMVLPPANLREVFFDSTTHLELPTMGNKQSGFIPLADVRWGGTNLAVIDWSLVNMLGDESKARQQHRLSDYFAAVRANRQLSIVLRDQGLNEDAARFAYRAQVLQKTVFRLQMLQSSISLRQRLRLLGAWLFSWFLFLLAGYGYKPARSFLAYLLVIGAFMILYLFLDPHLAWYEAIVVSMTAFHGRGFSPSTFSPGDPLSIASAVEAFVGLIIEVTFIATLTRRFFGQ
jgi:uncharacterized protein YjbI with pentapeptide repeats